MFVTGRRLFTGRTPELLEDWAIEVEADRIVGLGPRRQSTPDSEVVDLGDVTLLPGLVDAHQHLAFDASDAVVEHLAADDDATLLLRMRLSAQRALAVGITTIRDLGDRNYVSLTLRDWFRAGEEVGPRIVASGPPITIADGHCWFLGGVADGEDAIRRAVRERAERGVDVVKIMASGGNMTPTLAPYESQYGQSEIEVALEAAHAHGLPLAVHAHGGQAIADALAAGVDSIEHCTFFSVDGVDADPDVLARLAQGSSFISMTGALKPGVAAVYPAMQQRLAAIFANATTLHRAGARIVCSSDAGVGPNKPHDVLPYGVSHFLPAIGMTNFEALVATTALPAEVCGVSDVTGTLEVGKDADILAVAGNPLEDLAAIHAVTAVFARGARVPVTASRD